MKLATSGAAAVIEGEAAMQNETASSGVGAGDPQDHQRHHARL